METHCGTCDSVQSCEPTEEGSSTYICLTCGDDVEISASAGAGGKYDGYKIGKVLSVELIPKQKDLKKVVVDVVGDGDVGNALTIVTNAKYVEEGWLLVVATQGAIVPAGAVLDEDPDAIEVKKRPVGGVSSQGLLLLHVVLLFKIVYYYHFGVTQACCATVQCSGGLVVQRGQSSDCPILTRLGLPHRILGRDRHGGTACMLSQFLS